MPNIETRYFNLPFIGMYSKVTQNKNEKPCKRFWKVKLVFTSEVLKLRQTFSYKDSYPSVLSSKVVYKFVCASCNADYVDQTHRHLTTRINEHFGKDKKTYIPIINVISWLFECLLTWLLFFSRYCNNKASDAHKGKVVY